MTRTITLHLSAIAIALACVSCDDGAAPPPPETDVTWVTASASGRAVNLLESSGSLNMRELTPESVATESDHLIIGGTDMHDPNVLEFAEAIYQLGGAVAVTQPSDENTDLLYAITGPTPLSAPG